MDISTVHHWVRKSKDSGGKLDLNDQPQSGRPISATHNLNRQKVIQENWHISQTTIVEMLNIGLPMSMRLLHVWVTKLVCMMGIAYVYTWNEDSNTGSTSALTHLLWKWQQWHSAQQCHRGQEMGTSLWPKIEKPVTLILSPHFYHKEKIQDSTFYWKIYAHSFLGLQRHHSAGGHDQRQENQLPGWKRKEKKKRLLQHDKSDSTPV